MHEFVYGLRAGLMLVAVGIFVVVFAAMFFMAWRHHRRGAEEQSNFHGSVAIEMGWALIPCVIVLLLVWPTARIFWVS